MSDWWNAVKLAIYNYLMTHSPHAMFDDMLPYLTGIAAVFIVWKLWQAWQRGQN